MNEETEQITLSPADQRKLNRVVEKMRARGMQLETSHGGYIAHDSEGHMYAKQNGGLVRITVTPDDEPMRLAKKWGKRQRREARRAAKDGGRSKA